MGSVVLTVDVETTGLDANARVFAVGVLINDDEPVVFEWRVNPRNRQPIIPRNDVEQLVGLIGEADIVVGHNVKFDYIMLSRTLGAVVPDVWDWTKVRDTLLAAHMLNSGGRLNLTDLVREYLGVDISEPEVELRNAVIHSRSIARELGWSIADRNNPLTPSARGEPWRQDYWLPRELYLSAPTGTVPPEYETVCRRYLECDLISTATVWKRFSELIRQSSLEHIYAERLRLLPLVCDMETVGVGFSINRALELERWLEQQISSNRRTMEMVCRKFGVNIRVPESGVSNDIRNFVTGCLNLRLKRTQAGHSSISRESLIQLLEHVPDYSLEGIFLRALVRYRELAVARDYIQSYQKYCINGRLYPSFEPCGTRTLRWASHTPNQQNISKRESINLRYAFGPPEGYVWYAFDAENIELRIPAFESGEEEMIGVFQSNEPPFYGSYHLLIASILWPKQFDDSIRRGLHFKQAYPQLYKWVKNGNFATLYGGSDKTINQAYHHENAAQIIRSRFRKLARLSNTIYWFARRYGYVETIPDKDVDPKRGYPIAVTPDKHGRLNPGLPFNYHVQGTACWWICRAMVETYPLIRSFGGRIILQIHDEIVVEIPRDRDNPEVPIQIKQRLESINGIGVPISVSWERIDHAWGARPS